MRYSLGGALVLGWLLAFAWHLPAWAKRDAGQNGCHGLLGCVMNLFRFGDVEHRDWQSVVARWTPGRTFCVVRVICFPVQVQRYQVPPGGQLYAPRPGRVHYGVDFAGMDYGTPVYAPFNGQVVKVMRNLGACGDGMEIHTGFLIVRFCHVGPTVQSGQRVDAGQIVGYINTSGRQTGPHLHMETYVNGQVVSFEDFLKNLPQVAQVIVASGVQDERAGVLASSGPEVWQELSSLRDVTQSRLCAHPRSVPEGWACYNEAKHQGNQFLSNLIDSPSSVPRFPQLLAAMPEPQPPQSPQFLSVDAGLQRRIAGYAFGSSLP